MKLRALTCGAIVATLALVACTPGGQGAAETASPERVVVTDPDQLGTVTVTTLDTWASDDLPLARWMKALIVEFEEKYPGITIDRQTGAWDDVNKTLRLKLQEEGGPDVVPANNGWQGIGTFARAGLILDLEPYAEAYGWDERIPSTILSQHQVTADGTQIGTGHLFGVPISQGCFITVYFNRAKLDALGLDVPQTFADFEAALAAARAAGEVPLQLGTLDQWLATTVLFALQNVYGSIEDIGGFVYGTGTDQLADTGMTEAAAKLQEWAQAGYFPDDYSGIAGGDSAQAFVDGAGVFRFDYSDTLPFPDQAASDDFGAFLLPGQGGPAEQATGAANQNFSIAANSDAPDAAALWLDFLSSRRAGEIAVEQGVMPFLDSFDAPDAGALLGDEIASLTLIQGTDGFVPYFDWSSPTMLETLGAQAQLLLADRVTPEQLVEAGQKDYDDFRSDK